MDPRVRDALVLVGILGGLMGGLYLFTGTWPPAVIVESGSMMHAETDVPYGRFGTIDPGDLVLVKEVASSSDVETLVERGPTRYGKPGDVLVYFAGDDHARTPIIHRAIAYVVLAGIGPDRTYHVRWSASAACEGGASKDPSDAHWCVYGSEGILAPSFRIANGGAPYKPDKTGFITKGDNPVSNKAIDQVAGIAPGTVQLSWIQGKARGELPWLGLVKLSLGATYNEPECMGRDVHVLWFETIPTGACRGWFGIGHALAPKDLWMMLAILLFVVLVGPILFDVVRKRIRGRSAA